MNDWLPDRHEMTARKMTIDAWSARMSGGLARFYVRVADHTDYRLHFVYGIEFVDDEPANDNGYESDESDE